MGLFPLEKVVDGVMGHFLGADSENMAHITHIHPCLERSKILTKNTQISCKYFLNLWVPELLKRAKQKNSVDPKKFFACSKIGTFWKFLVFYRKIVSMMNFDEVLQPQNVSDCL